MNIVIKKKPHLTYTIKMAAVTLLVFAVVGLIVRFTRDADRESPGSGQSLGHILTASSSLLIPSIPLRVPTDGNEHQWTTALSETIRGKPEVSVQFGRADVLTENYAVEVDFLPKWKEGLGQALHYGDVTGLIPVLALIAREPPDEELLKQIERLCASKGVKVVLLVPEI
jgi:hypothetical protein